MGLETLFPALALALIQAAGWRDAFALMAAIAAGSLCCAALLLHNSPAAASVAGDAADGQSRDHDDALAGFTVSEAMRVPAFWLCLAAGALGALFWTGINLLAVSIFGERHLLPEVCLCV